MIISFSNPNYNPNEADALNSNLPISQYYDDNHIYEDVDSNSPLLDDTSKTNSSLKRRKIYAQLDLNSMGVDPTDETLTPLSQDENINSPSSVFSVDSRHSNDSFSSLTERATEIVEVEHTEEDDDMAPYAEMPARQGFLGYYASLERSVKSRKKKEEEEFEVNAEGNNEPNDETQVEKDGKEEDKAEENSKK